MKNKFMFLKSVRFWKLFIVAVAQFLSSQGIIDLTVANGLSILLLGSVTVKTVDRFSEKLAERKTE